MAYEAGGDLGLLVRKLKAQIAEQQLERKKLEAEVAEKERLLAREASPRPIGQGSTRSRTESGGTIPAPVEAARSSSTVA